MIMVKYTNGTLTEQSRVTVPIYYEGKEDFITRIEDNTRLAKPVQIVLPRASFEIASFNYASARKLSTYNSITLPGINNGSAAQQYQPVPWDIGFNLYIYTRNVEDGTQLIEQILPIFTPNYTLTINYVPEMGIYRNAPMILNSVNFSNEYEGNSDEAERVLIWTLGFTLQANFYGPINTGNVITQVNTNFYIDTTLGTNGLASDVEVNLTPGGNGNYQINEFVYQGANLPDASVTGQVTTWNASGNVLVLANVAGSLQPNVQLIGATTGATYYVAQTSPDIKMATITITPDPPGANAQTAFGFDTTITEFPLTIQS